MDTHTHLSKTDSVQFSLTDTTGEVFTVKKLLHVGMELRKHGNKVEIKTQTTKLIQKHSGEERQPYMQWFFTENFFSWLHSFCVLQTRNFVKQRLATQHTVTKGQFTTVPPVVK